MEEQGVVLGELTPDIAADLVRRSPWRCDRQQHAVFIVKRFVEYLRPNPVKPTREKSVRGEEPNPPWVLPSQDAHLMPQANELEFQGCAATKPEGEDGNDGRQNRDHASDDTAVAKKSQNSAIFI